LREGLRVAIVGRPNVGKSSLLNRLLGTERAIVTPIAGTTRDTVEERALLGGIALHLVDTAGLTPTEDPIERIGVERSRAAAQSADLLLFVLDASCPLTEPDWHAAVDLRDLVDIGLLQSSAELEAVSVAPASSQPHVEGRSSQHVAAAHAQYDQTAVALRPVILVLNKADLSPIIREAEAASLWPGAPLVHTSTLTREGVAPLVDEIVRLALGDRGTPSDVLVSSARHHDALRRACEHLANAATTLDDCLPLDFVSIDLRAALDALGEITGETASADLLDRIFAEFCIGK
jgi:tRNA modification GTPase